MNTEQERAELLPCPFCGCAMSLSAVARDWWRIAGKHDDDCILHDQRHDAPQTDEQKQLLIKAWNRRAALQPRPEVVGVTLDGCLETLFRVGEYLGIDYVAARKAPRAPSDVYIKAIEDRAALQSQSKPNDLMLSAVIRMPFEMAMASEISRLQFYQRAQQALNDLEALQSQDREDDPLQTAANWLIQAIESCTVADIQGRLSIGYNRAQRLLDHATQSQDRELDDEEILTVSQAVVAERLRDKEDAERYRWLRLQRTISDHACVTWNIGHDWIQMDGMELDNAIDHARRVEGEK